MRIANLPTLGFVRPDASIEHLHLTGEGAAIAAKAAWLRDRFAAGDVLALAMRTGPDLVLCWLGAIAAGLRPLILQYPTAKQSRAYWQGSVLHTIGLAGCRAIVGDERVRALLEGQDVAVVPPEFGADRTEPPLVEIAAFSILQLSSGTTGHRKAIEFPSDRLEIHARDYAKSLTLDRDAHIVSWLPLYHDMGFIACFVMPLILGVPVTMIDPETWVADKALLFATIAAVRGTICYMPNFGFEVMAQFPPGDLSSMRHWISCSEPVMEATARRFLAATGTPEPAFAACYAMAENIFAVTQSAGLTTHEIDGVPVVSCGRPIAGVEVKIAEAQIWVKSPASLCNYFGGDDIRDAEGFYPTGDLGSLIDGELYVTGRSRDLLIQAGKKFMLSNIDAVVNETVAGTKGRVAAVVLRDARLGTEKPAVIIEAIDFYKRTDHAEIAERLLDATGLDYVEVHFVPPLFLTKTSSGKINRVLSAKHWEERLRDDAGRTPVSLSAELEKTFGKLVQDRPVEEIMDSLSTTLLRIILVDAGVEYDGTKTLAGYAALLAEAAPAAATQDVFRIVSLADRRPLRTMETGTIDRLAQRLGMPVSFEHVCLPPSPILLSDLIFFDYFRPRLEKDDEYEAMRRAFAKLKAADMLIIDDAAELHFPITQFYPVLSHRLERSSDADLLAYRWQRYVEHHHRLPIAVVDGSTLSLTDRKTTIDALSDYLSVPIFRIASSQSLARYTADWDYRPLHSPSGGPGLRIHKLEELIETLAKWVETRIADGRIKHYDGPPEAKTLDLTDLAHFCSHGVAPEAVDQFVARYQHFCVVGQRSSARYVIESIARQKKTYVRAPSFSDQVLAELGSFDCMLSCGPTGNFENDTPAGAVMRAGWKTHAQNVPDELAGLKLYGNLPNSPPGEWFALLADSASNDAGQINEILDARKTAYFERQRRTAEREKRPAAQSAIRPPRPPREPPADDREKSASEITRQARVDARIRERRIEREAERAGQGPRGAAGSRVGKRAGTPRDMTKADA